MKTTRSGSSILLRAAGHLAKRHLIDKMPFVHAERYNETAALFLVLHMYSPLPDDIFRCLMEALYRAEEESLAAHSEESAAEKGSAA